MLGTVLLVIVGIAVFASLCGAFANNPGIIGSIANILWYLWRKLWGLIAIVIVILAIRWLFGNAFV